MSRKRRSPRPQPVQPQGPSAQAIAAELLKMIQAPRGATVTDLVPQATQAGLQQSPGWGAGQAVPLVPGGWTDPLVPFGPGRPIRPATIDPLGADGRPLPRRSEYPVSFNLPGGGDRVMPWTVLRQLADGVGIIRKCIEIRKGQITQLDWDFVASESAFEAAMVGAAGTAVEASRARAATGGDRDAKTEQRAAMPASRAAWERSFRRDNAEQITNLKRWWKHPDRIQGWTMEDWLGAAMEEALVLDALSIFPRATLGGDLHSLMILDGSCYSDDTEVLTRRGWLRFADTTADDEFATRNQKTHAFEWQQATYFHKAPHDGPMYHFTSKALDILVTPNHRMLVTAMPRGLGGGGRNTAGEVIVRADDLAAHGNGQASLIPTTSRWDGEPLREFVLDADASSTLVVMRNVAGARKAAGMSQRAAGQAAGLTHQTYWSAENGKRVRLATAEAIRSALGGDVDWTVAGSFAKGVAMTGDDYAAFMGMYLSEGCYTAGDQVMISQMPQSKGFDDYKALLERIFGREVCHTGKAFVVGRKCLHDYLSQFGKAHEKHAPDLIKNLPPQQLDIFWRFYMLGDGCYSDGRERISTVSRRMADDLQEIAQKIGLSASVIARTVTRDAVMADGRVVRAENSRPFYIVSLSRTEARTWNVAETEYHGDVFCVSVPNEVLYVRRNGRAAWCGNTIKPLLDHTGSTPQPPSPAYQQILHGFPRGEFTASTAADGEYTAGSLIYRPRNRRTHSPYGYGPTEQAIQDADLYMKRRLWMNSEYDDGVAPELLINVNANMTPDQLRAYETVFNDMLSGNIAERHRAKMLPAGFVPTLLPSLESRYKPDYDLFLIRMIGNHYDITAQELGFPPSGGLGGAGFDEGDERRNERRAVKPTAKWMAGIINAISGEYLRMPETLEFSFIFADDEDDEAAESERIKTGRKTINEGRDEAGLPRFDIPEADMPLLHVGNTVIPLSGLADRANTVLTTATAQAAPAAPAAGKPDDTETDQGDTEDDEEQQPADGEREPAKTPAPRTAKAAGPDDETGPAPVVAAGLAVQARSTGRVLMLQRALTDGDPASGAWELPGGCRDGAETPEETARREWAEETGMHVPPGDVTGGWQAGGYVGVVLSVPDEDAVNIRGDRWVTNPDDPDCDVTEALAWWAPADLPGNTALRAELAASLDVVLAALGADEKAKATEAGEFRAFLRRVRKGDRPWRAFGFQAFPSHIGEAANSLAAEGQWAAATAVLDL